MHVSGIVKLQLRLLVQSAVTLSLFLDEALNATLTLDHDVRSYVRVSFILTLILKSYLRSYFRYVESLEERSNENK